MAEEEASPGASPDAEDARAAEAAAEEPETAVDNLAAEPEPTEAPDAATADEPAESSAEAREPGAGEADAETPAAEAIEAGGFEEGAAMEDGVAADSGGEGEAGGEDDAGEASEAAANDVETGRVAATKEAVPDDSVASEAAAGESAQGDELDNPAEAAMLNPEGAGADALAPEALSTANAGMPSGRIDELKAKAANGEELTDAELAEMQVGYDQLEAEEKRLGGPDSLPGAVPDDTPEMSGHVDALELSATISTPASGHAEPNGKQADEQPKGFARSKKAETAELSESTIGVRGLNSDVKVRSKIRKPAPQRPLEMATTAPVMPVLMSAEPEPNPNVMQLWMDRDRRAAAIAFGFSEGGPLQSHKLEHATPRPPVAAPIVAPTAALLPSSARPAPLVELGRSPSPVRGKPAHAGFVSSAVSIPAGGISPAHEDRGLLSAMAQESVASAQRHAAARGQPALSPALSPVKHGLARAGSGAGLSSVKGSAKLTWDSLEEMSFEDLLSLDARSAFSQLPPLPDRGSSHPSTRDPDTARELAARANASRPSGVERPPQQADRAGQRAGRAAPERAPPQPNPPPKKREVHPPPAPAQATPRRNTGQPPAQPTSAPTPTKRAPTGKAEPVVPAATTSRRAAASKEPSAPRTETEPALHSAPAARSKSTQDVRRTEVAAQGRGRGEAVEPAAPPNPPNKSSRSAPVQRPSAPKKAPPQQRAEELPQPREVQERSRRGKPAEQKTAPSASAPGPVIVPPKVQAPYGFEHGYMMPPMNYGMLGSPFGPPPMINPYQMMAPPPAGLAAHFMPMHGPAAVYGMGPGLAQRTWMRGDEVQQKGMRVGGRGKV